MFTIRVETPTGHVIRECVHYQYRRAELDNEGLPRSISSLVLDDGREGWQIVPVGVDNIYVMNANGKTIDRLYPFDPTDPLRWAIDPETAKRIAPLVPLAARYVERMGPGPEKQATI